MAFLKDDLRLWKNFFKTKPVYNVFKTEYSKKALISYITAPFKSTPSITHTNSQEALAMARVLNELGFIVDVAEFNDNSPFDYSGYQLIIGFGEPLINSYNSPACPENCKRIYYGTGMHIVEQNHATLRRIKEVHEKTGQWFLSSGRIVGKAWSVQTTLVDAIITFGEEPLITTYRQFFEGPIYKIPVSTYEIFTSTDIINSRNYSEAKNHYYWQGGSLGSIHKGLDLLLEVFKKHPEWHLHITHSFALEPQFEEFYHDLLYKTENIHTHGFVLHNSDTAKEILEQCAFVIQPSCSEGTSTSVTNLMRHGGLIPIVTAASGLPPEPFVIPIDSLSVEAIEKALESSQKISENELKETCTKVYNFTKKTYSLENYSLKLKESLEKVIAAKK